MKTLEEAREYIAGVEKWEDEEGTVAEPDDRYFDLLKFKRTIDLSPYDLEVRNTNAFGDDVDLTDTDLERDFEWRVRLEGLGSAVIGIFAYPADTSVPGFWAELYIEDEPYWNDDPYFCTVEQIDALVGKLPEAHLDRFQELAALNPVTTKHFKKAGVFKTETPKIR